MLESVTFAAQEILRTVDAGDDSVFILYEYELKAGARHRNAEYITVRDGRLVETQVFFGGSVRLPPRRQRQATRG